MDRLIQCTSHAPKPFFNKLLYNCIAILKPTRAYSNVLSQARLSFLSRSTPRLTTSSPSDPSAPEFKLKFDGNLWGNGISAADVIEQENSWDSSKKEKSKETNQSKNSGILSEIHGANDTIAASFQAKRRIWMYDEFHVSLNPVCFYTGHHKVNGRSDFDESLKF